MTDTLHEVIRLVSQHARRAGYAEAAAEALCEQIERLATDTLASRRMRDEIADLKASARRVQAALEEKPIDA